VTHQHFDATTNITLRDVHPADLPALFAFQSDHESCAMAMVKPRTLEAFDARWTQTFNEIAAGTPGILCKAILANDQLCGSIGSFPIEGELSVGYAIARDFWHRGIASSALALLLAEMSVRPLHARAAASNTASIRVLTKNGFTITGTHSSTETDRYLACEEVRLTLA